jgi:hypothetical protein
MCASEDSIRAVCLAWSKAVPHLHAIARHWFDKRIHNVQLVLLQTFRSESTVFHV